MQKPLVVANWRIANHESSQARIERELPRYTLCMIRDLFQICLDSCIVYSRHNGFKSFGLWWIHLNRTRPHLWSECCKRRWKIQRHSFGALAKAFAVLLSFIVIWWEQFFNGFNLVWFQLQSLLSFNDRIVSLIYLWMRDVVHVDGHEDRVL